MKKRNPFIVVLLSLITFGIYDLYWLVVVKKELNQKTKFHVPSIILLIIPYLVLIAGYIVLFSSGSWKISKTTTTSYGYSSTAASVTSSTGGHVNSGVAAIGIILIIIGAVTGLLITIYWLFKFSKAVNEYTNGKMSTAISFLLLWLVHLIGVALIQDAFNDMLEAGVSGPAPMQPAMAGTAPVVPGLQPTPQGPSQDIVAPTPSQQPSPTVEPTNQDSQGSTGQTPPQGPTLS